MAQSWQAFPSAVTNSVNSYDRTVVEPPESIGKPTDAAATDVADENSMFSLGKGMLDGLGVAAGSGDGAVNTDPHVFVDPIDSLGAMDDAPADDDGSGDWTAIALLKGVLAQAGI